MAGASFPAADFAGFQSEGAGFEGIRIINTLHHTEKHCNRMKNNCNTMQFTPFHKGYASSTRCNTLQHTATQ